MLASRCILEILYKHKSLSASYEKPAPTNQFDAGAAWENLALEAIFRGIATGGMQGFDYEKVSLFTARVVSSETFVVVFSDSFFDAGAAWENLALEAIFRGIATGGMQGFDYEQANKVVVYF